jgi:hypothetical protein
VAPPKQAPAKLLKEIEQNIAAIASPKIEKKPELEVPSLPVVEEAVMESATEKIAQFLQQMLQLPEFGEVRVLVMIDRTGQLENFEVLDTKSEKNAEFLRNQLPSLRFPCLNETVSLTIVFSNE